MSTKPMDLFIAHQYDLCYIYGLWYFILSCVAKKHIRKNQESTTLKRLCVKTISPVVTQLVAGMHDSAAN